MLRVDLPFHPPSPTIHPDVATFWEAVADGEFLLQRCRPCNTVRFPPTSICWSCLSDEQDLVSVGPGGVLTTLVTVHRSPPGSPFGKATPYRVGLFELNGNIRVPGLIACKCGREIPLGSELFLCQVEADGGRSIYAFAHACVR